MLWAFDTQERAVEGLYLEQVDNEFYFLRLYDDGELLFQTATYTWPRAKAIADVSRWFKRGQKKTPVPIEPHRYRYENGIIAFEYTAGKRRFEVRGEVDAIGRVALRWRDDLGAEWVHVYSRVGEGGAAVPVYVNAANVDGLTDLPGVNKALAARIVEYREQHGPFKGPEDLLKIKGVTEAKLTAIKERCDFAEAPAIVTLAAPTPKLNVTRELLAKELADEDHPPTPAQAASFLRKIGRFDVYLEERNPGNWPLTILAYARGGDAFVLRGHRVDDQGLLLPLLEAVDRCSEQDLQKLRGVRVVPLESERFNRVVIVPGHLESYYRPPLGAVVHRFYPTRDFEVPDGMSMADFELLTHGGRKARLDLFDWKRKPQPLLKLKVVDPPPGSGFERMPERELANPDLTAAGLSKYLKEGKVELWDIADRHVILEGTEAAILATRTGPGASGGTIEIPHDSFGVALDRFLKGGSLS
jgi:competence ComEA-like helix-hairpin-helix protein